MKKGKDVDPTIHYAALRWFYLLHVLSKRIVYNLATYKRYKLPRTGCTKPAKLWWGVNKRGWVFPGKAIASAHSHGLKFSFASRYKYLALKLPVSWPSPAWKHMVSLLLSLFKKGNSSPRKLLSKSAPAFTCSVQMAPTFSLLPGLSRLAYSNLL